MRLAPDSFQSGVLNLLNFQSQNMLEIFICFNCLLKQKRHIQNGLDAWMSIYESKIKVKWKFRLK